MPAIDQLIVLIINVAALPVGVFAFIHALVQRSDAYTATNRMTKPAWLGLTGGGSAVLLLFNFYGPGMIFWIAALVAVLVYIVDVRPKLIEIQGRSW